MRLPIFILLLLLSLPAAPLVWAQQPALAINLRHPDLSRLELLTHLSVNVLREEAGEPALIWDEVLYRAAQDHAQYLIGELKLSHFQEIKGRRTPAERVKLHGGMVYGTTGENIVEILLGVQYSSKGNNRCTITYEGAAQTMAQAWRLSTGHYKNIISPKYNSTALATAYDSASQRLVAVQVFGFTNTPFNPIVLPDPASHLQKLPKPTLPYGLKEYRYHPKNQKAVRGFLKMELDRGYLTGSYKAAKKIFRGRRSGLVQEFIPLSQFDSASPAFVLLPNRRNAQHELNGTLGRPVYRRELLRYSRRNTIRDFYINTRLLRIKKPAQFFAFPLQPNGREKEFNLFLLKHRQLEVYRSYMMVPSGLFGMAFPDLSFTNSFRATITGDKNRYIHVYDTLQFQIWYGAGEAEIDVGKQAEILAAFGGTQKKIVDVEAAAFASVEGDKIENEQLAAKRMEGFMLLVRPFLDSLQLQPKIETREQWRLFAQQLEGTRLQHLKKMKLEEVRQYVNQHLDDSLLVGSLNAQRYLKIRVIRRQEVQHTLTGISSQQLYDSILSLVKSKAKPGIHLLRALEQAQLSLYYDLSQAESLPQQAPSILHLDNYPAFSYHDLVFRYTILQQMSDKEFFQGLQRLAASRYFPAQLKGQLIYNNQVLLFRSFIKDELTELLEYENLDCYKYRQAIFQLRKFKSPKCRKPALFLLPPPEYFVLKELPALIARAEREKIKDFPAAELWKFYYLYTIHSLYVFIPIHPEIYGILPKFKDHFHPDDATLSDEEKLKLAFFYCALDRYATAKMLLEPIAARPQPNHQVLKLYLTLRYDDYKEEHAFAELLIKEYERLGQKEWCDLWVNPEYLNFLLLEDLKLKNFYNCNCPGSSGSEIEP